MKDLLWLILVLVVGAYAIGLMCYALALLALLIVS